MSSWREHVLTEYNKKEDVEPRKPPPDRVRLPAKPNPWHNASVDDLVAEIKAIDNRIAEANKNYAVWYADLLRRRISCVNELDARGEPISDYTKRRRRFPEKTKAEEKRYSTQKKFSVTDAQLARAKKLFRSGMSIEDIAALIVMEENLGASQYAT